MVTLKDIRDIKRKLYAWYGRKNVLGVLIFMLVLLVVGVFMHANGLEPAEEAAERTPTVTLSLVNELSENRMLELIGTVESIDEVRLDSEASGRITDVPVEIGKNVRAGAVIARIENADERAALLQAEGAYESAVASAASSDIGVSEAQNNAVSAYKDAYATVHDIIINTVDDLFAEPKSTVVAGLRINGFGHTSFLNNERKTYNSLLSEWQQRTTSISTNNDLYQALEEAHTRVVRTQKIVQTFLEILPRQDEERYTQAELDAFQNDFVNAQRSLNATISALDGARESLSRAEVSGTGNVVSSADAQVKQALGSLRAAQANYEKTIVRTPISGTVNTLSVDRGDYVSATAPIAVIANNDSLFITTHVNESARDRIAVGDTVSIEGGAEGTITNIAPVVDPVTKKIEVQIETDDISTLNNGNTVRLSIMASTALTENEQITIPIRSLKVGTERTVVFTVSDEDALVAHEVETGPLMGDRIIIRSGITRDMRIVEDARGLNEGDVISVNQ